VLLAGLLFLAVGTCGAPAPRPLERVGAAEANSACGTVASFYQSNPGVRLWTGGPGETGRGRELAQALHAASADGLDPRRYRPVGPDRESGLSEALIRYAEDLRQAPPEARIYYVDESLKPTPPCAAALLQQASAAPSLSAFLSQLREPNIVAAALRRALASATSEETRIRLRQDLAIARSLGSPKRFVLVDTTAQRLWMIADNRVAGAMKVAVGKEGMDTPNMAALVRYAVVNPYWDIPPDMIRNEVAPHILASGPAYLDQQGFEAVTSYDPSARPLDAAEVDWHAVRNGSKKVGIRQVPGPENMMGRVMFMFPNRLGIYLHDTPAKWLFSKTDRRVSHGCVRLEHAEALYAWLFGGDLDAAPIEAAASQDLPQPVPVYILNLSRAGAPLTDER
jgi:L,D-transpeptidase YcbB